MNIQTGIAVGLAVIVIGGVFIYPQVINQLPGTDMMSGAEAAGQNTGGGAPSATELQIVDQVVGPGEAIRAGDEITVNYIGMLPDGKVFDASANHGGPATFDIGVGQVIKGWDQGLIGMKEGGTRILVIPPNLGYGSSGFGDAIPPNATLLFEIQLIKVTHK